jgi:hypothetical protein
MLPNFETLFGIPHHYRLVLIRSRSRGGRVRGDYWSHHEVDPSGAVIAVYESYDEVDARGQPQCGWRKYDALGSLADVQTVSSSWSAPSREPRLAA